MKTFHIKYLLICILAFFSITATAQDEIADAIKKGDVEAISAYFDSNVDMKILDKENIFSKAQAKLLLKDFFSSHTPENFTINHKGGPESAKFAIGNLKTSKGNYRVYFLFKQKGQQLLIQKFRIENDG